MTPESSLSESESVMKALLQDASINEFSVRAALELAAAAAIGALRSRLSIQRERLEQMKKEMTKRMHGPTARTTFTELQSWLAALDSILKEEGT